MLNLFGGNTPGSYEISIFWAGLVFFVLLFFWIAKKKKLNDGEHSLLWLVSFLLSISVFFTVAYLAISDKFDFVYIQDFLVPSLSGGLTDFFLAVTYLSSPFMLGTASVVIAFLFYKKKRYFYMLFFVLSIIIGVIGRTVFKFFFQIARPENGIITVSGFSFLSGHATLSSAFFFVLLAILFFMPRDEKKRVIFTFACLSLVYFIVLSRVYLGVHRIEDVIAGLFLGISAVCLSYLFSSVMIALKNRPEHLE